MSQEQDKIFFRNFSLVLALIALMMVAFYAIAKLTTTKKQNTVEIEVKENTLSIKSAKILNDGAISITWSHPVTANDSGVSIFQPSWLYQTGLFGGIYHENDLEIETWEAKEFNNIISIDGNDYLGNKESFKKMLQTIIKFGVVVIKGLPVKEGMLEEVVSKIGTIRSSNFGKIFESPPDIFLINFG